MVSDVGNVAYTCKCNIDSTMTLCKHGQIQNKCGKKHLGVSSIALVIPLLTSVSDCSSFSDLLMKCQWETLLTSLFKGGFSFLYR